MQRDGFVKRQASIIFRVAIGVAALVFEVAQTHAQTLEPRSYSNSPVGLNFLLAGYEYTEGSVAFDPSLPISDAHLHTNATFLAYARSLNAWGDSAKFDVELPYVWLEGSAPAGGSPRQRDVSGVADPSFRFSVNFYGAPALSAKEFADYHQDFIVGASLRVFAPFGQYDDTKLVNIGTNRWTIKPELGISKALGSWTLEHFFLRHLVRIGRHPLCGRPHNRKRQHTGYLAVNYPCWPDRRAADQPKQFREDLH